MRLLFIQNLHKIFDEDRNTGFWEVWDDNNPKQKINLVLEIIRIANGRLQAVLDHF